MKKLLIFLLIFSLITFISCGEDDATSVTEEKAVCGNGLVEDGEECDPIVDQDCSDECEWTEDVPLQGEHFEDINSPLPPNITTFKRAGEGYCRGTDDRDIIHIDICVLRYLNSAGHGKSASYARGKIDGVQSIYDNVNTGIKFKIIYDEGFTKSTTAQTDPTTKAELGALFIHMKNKLSKKKCDIYIGFNNSLKIPHPALKKPDGTYSSAAGYSTLPWSESSKVHTTVISTGSSSAIAHEIGHLFGLEHTFAKKPEQDYCTDTAVDNYMSSSYPTCNANYSNHVIRCAEYATCTGTSAAITRNTMSYYACKASISNDNFTNDQINRMRCYIDKMNIGHRDRSACYPSDKNFCDGKEEKEKKCGSNKVCYDHKCISKESLATNSKHWEWYKAQARNQFSFGEEIEFYKVKTIGAIKSNFKESAGSVKAVIDGQYSSSEFVKRVFNEALTPGSGDFKLTCGDDPSSWKSSCEFKLNKNGGSKTKPRINDVIIWKSANYGKGHLAVVTSVTNDGVFVTQQNLTHSKKDKDMQLNLRYEEVNGQLVYTIETDRNFGCEQPEGWLRLKSEECTKFKNSGFGIDNASCETCTDDKRAINIGDTICGTGNRYTLEVVQGVGDDSACKYFKIKDDCEKKGESCRMSGGEASCMPVGSLGNGGGCNNMSSTDNSYFALFFILFLLSIVVRRKKLIKNYKILSILKIF